MKRTGPLLDLQCGQARRANLKVVATPPMPTGSRRPDWLPLHGAVLATLSRVASRFPMIGPCLGASALLPLELPLARFEGVLGWGDRLPARLARRIADIRGLPFWTLEDGFLRSAGLGKDGAASVSLIADDLGIHFSPERPSRLEQILNGVPSIEARARAQNLREWIVRERLTKYNHLPDRSLGIPATRKRRILLVDQVRGDRSVGPQAIASTLFGRMWREASRRGDAHILVRSHPDVLAGKAQSQLKPVVQASADWIDEPVSAHSVLDCVDEVWTVSSQLGLDALLRGIPVVTFGAPGYAGWGLTEDRADETWAVAAFARRKRRPSLDDFVAAAFLHYPLYYDPVKRRPTDAESAIERLLSLRRHALERSGHHLLVGFSRHKRQFIRRFIEGPSSTIGFASRRASTRQLAAADHVLVWGDVLPATAATPRRLVHVEDGFIRSAGLGAALAPPASLCFDAAALHCDATRASELEALLNTTTFAPALLHRARRLRDRLIATAITKYNLVAAEGPDYRQLAGGRHLVVVAGQVPGDRAQALGLALHRSNLDLLLAVRAEQPDAFLVYKEHPDLVTGLRPGATPSQLMRHHADLIVGNVSVCALLDAADEIHVSTSQLGFEALLRGKQTVCHGVPFYAGWGLNAQRRIPPRPRRPLSLDELVAGTLILYPRYVSILSHLPCEVEDVVEELVQHRDAYGDRLFRRERPR